MRKIFLLAATASIFILSAMPVQATHGNVDFFDGNRQGDHWNPAQTEPFCISPEFQDALPSGQEANMIDAVRTGLTRWETETLLPNTIFSVQAYCGNFNMGQEWNNASSLADFCNNIPLSRPSSIQLEDSSVFGAGTSGATLTCDRNGNGYIDYFAIWIDKDWQNIGRMHWGFDPSNLPDPGDTDFPGLWMHEFGHALGWDYNDGHLFGHCAHDGSWHTMCAGTYGFYNDYGSESSGHISRTLENYDISETNDAY